MKRCTEEIDALIASASLPYVSKPVEYRGMKLLDGGCTDRVPLAAFEAMGYERNIVVMTHPREHRVRDRDAALAAGDGICIGADGTNVNSVEGRRIAPNRMPASIRPGAAVYRCITSAMESRVLETTANILTALKLAGAIGIGSVIILVLPQAWFSFFPRLKRKNS